MVGRPEAPGRPLAPLMEVGRPAVKVALYARVSTAGQDPEVQLAPLRAHVANRGWQIVEEFVDRGFSGARERRPALDRLMPDRPWKAHERHAARLLRGRRFPANTGGRADVESPRLLSSASS